jgi:hypothetical protein
MTYNFKAIPEATWTAFATAAAGLAGALCVEFGVSDVLTVAITAFIGGFFRLVIAGLIAAAPTVTDETGHADLSGAVTVLAIVLLVLIFLIVTDTIEWTA